MLTTCGPTQDTVRQPGSAWDMSTPYASIVTPTHKLDWLERAYRSLLLQTAMHWEWIVGLNGDAKEAAEAVRSLTQNDDRVKVVVIPDSPNVGTLKRLTIEHATSEILIELDHDDELAANCVWEVINAFGRSPNAAMVYSDCDQRNNDGKPRLYSMDWGWVYRPSLFGAEEVPAPQAPPPWPQNLARIWFSPDHVRAWRRFAYHAVGGHRDMSICDDVDLTCRLALQFGAPIHIEKTLYRYHIHDGNTFLERNAEIQVAAWRVYMEHIYPLSVALSGGEAYDLGGMKAPAPRWKTVDVMDGADIVTDLAGRWPFEDNQVSVFRAHDVIEHLRNPIHTMNEAWRCLRHGGLFLIEVPSTDGRGAFQDPTHVSFWNQNNFLYYTRPQQRHYIEPAVEAKFQAIRVLTHYPTKWHQELKIPYVQAHLAAIKDGTRLHGGQELL